MILKTIPGSFLFCHSQVVEKYQEQRMIRSGESLTCCWLCNLHCSLLLGSWSRLVPQDLCSHGGGEIQDCLEILIHFIFVFVLQVMFDECALGVCSLGSYEVLPCPPDHLPSAPFQQSSYLVLAWVHTWGQLGTGERVEAGADPVPWCPRECDIK